MEKSRDETMNCDYTRPIHNKISPLLALGIIQDIESKGTSQLEDKIKYSTIAVLESLQPIARPNGHNPEPPVSTERVPWTLPLCDMRMAVVWILCFAEPIRQLRSKLDGQNVPNIDVIMQEMIDITKNSVRQIVDAGETDFANWLEQDVSPGLMMEINHGIDPLQGAYGLIPTE